VAQYELSSNIKSFFEIGSSNFDCENTIEKSRQTKL